MQEEKQMELIKDKLIEKMKKKFSFKKYIKNWFGKLSTIKENVNKEEELYESDESDPKVHAKVCSEYTSSEGSICSTDDDDFVPD